MHCTEIDEEDQGLQPDFAAQRGPTATGRRTEARRDPPKQGGSGQREEGGNRCTTIDDSQATCVEEENDEDDWNMMPPAWEEPPPPAPERNIQDIIIIFTESSMGCGDEFVCVSFSHEHKSVSRVDAGIHGRRALSLRTRDDEFSHVSDFRSAETRSHGQVCASIDECTCWNEGGELFETHDFAVQ